jgi:hypothetical protein
MANFFAECEMPHGREMVKVFVMGVTDQFGGDIVNAWVPKECVERGEKVESGWGDRDKWSTMGGLEEVEMI